MVKTSTLKIVIYEDKCVGCLICQLWCSYTFKKKYSPSEAYITIKNAYKLSPTISFSKNCTNCGQCAQHCLYGALKLEEAEL